MHGRVVSGIALAAAFAAALVLLRGARAPHPAADRTAADPVDPGAAKALAGDGAGGAGRGGGATPATGGTVAPGEAPAAAGASTLPAPVGAAAAPATGAPDPPSRWSVERLRARLDAMARGEIPVTEAPDAGALLRYLAKARAVLDAGHFHGLHARGADCRPVVALLSDAALDEVVAVIAASMVPGRPSPYDGMQYELGGALARRGGDRAHRLAGELAGSPDPRVREAAAVAAQARPPRPEVLAALARDPDGAVRATALHMIEALLDDGDAEAAPFEEAVFAGLDDAVAEVREAAMKCLPHFGARGGRRAAEILLSGAHRACDASPGALVRAALLHAPTRLLAEPVAAALVADLALAVADRFFESDGAAGASLLRPLLPMARRMLDARLADEDAGSPAHRAEPYLEALAAGGAFEDLRRFAADASLVAPVRRCAMEALVEGAPPVEWEAALASWLQAGVPAAERVELLRGIVFLASPHFAGADDGAAREEAWARVLRAAGEFADDEGVALEARRLRASLGGR